MKGGSTFHIALGQESVYNFTVTDDSDNFIVTAVGDLGNSSISFTNDSNGKFSFRVIMHEPTIFTLTFVAQDSIVAASLDPIIELCGCTNGGNCTLQGLLQTEFTTTIMNCECPEGTYVYTYKCSIYIIESNIMILYNYTAYSGQFCESDADGCSEIQCFEGVTCIDVKAPGVGANCGPCPMGFTGDGYKCIGNKITSL